MYLKNLQREILSMAISRQMPRTTKGGLGSGSPAGVTGCQVSEP